jgi:hypothetical protein
VNNAIGMTITDTLSQLCKFKSVAYDTVILTSMGKGERSSFKLLHGQ